MPIATSPSPTGARDIITKFTNCTLVRDGALVASDLWVSSASGKILHSQEAFYGSHVVPDQVIDLGGRILAPGLMDVQLNGAFGVDFSSVPEGDEDGKGRTYVKKLRDVNRKMVRMGVTSYLPTLTSQKSNVYHALLPYLGPSGTKRLAEDGAESLGAHCEGPFLNPGKNGIHSTDVLIAAPNGIRDLEACYGASNISHTAFRPANVKLITAAPEVGAMMSAIPELNNRGILFSMGHSEATYEEASAAVGAGATMITHLFNAMRPLHHRNPGIFGVLGDGEVNRPFFGVIADGVHLHRTAVRIAWSAYPAGCVLVTDAMHLAGLEDGLYPWGEGLIRKIGGKLVLEGEGKIAGSSISLIECVNNFLSWTGASVPEALRTVTETPARLLGLQGVKGTLQEGADADLVVFSRDESGLVIDQVWKFGSKVFEKGQ